MADDSSSSPRRPRSVLVVEDNFYHRLASDPDDISLLEDRDAMIVPYSAKPDFHHSVVNALRDMLLDSGQLIPGALLVKNPYETASYEFAEHAVESFASAKYHALANTARLLGAREVRFLEAKASSTTMRAGGSAKAKVAVVDVNADATQELAKKLGERLEGHLTFPGSDPSTDEATAYLQRRNLANDQQLKDLIEMRTGRNPIQAYQMTLSGTRESTAALKSALKISAAAPIKAVIDIGATFSRTAESMSNIEIVTEIVF